MKIMDFIDWCHYVLGALEKEKLKGYINFHDIPEIVFSKDLIEEEDFHNSDPLTGLNQTLVMLADADLVDNEDSSDWKISKFGRKEFADPINFWSEICNEILNSEQELLLKTVNKFSPQLDETQNYGWLKEVEKGEICSAFKIKLPSFETNEQLDEFDELVQDLQLREFLKVYPNGVVIYPTYKGLVWELKRNETIESKLIDELIKDWETTNVDFKREINLDTKKQKAEFAKDVLGLATTKSSGKRYMIIGFDDKTRQYYAPPNATVTQNRMEQVLSDLTEPVVTIRYEIVDYRLGKVGKLEIFREPEKLPYKAKKDGFDDKGKKCFQKDKVYVRHGSQTESLSTASAELDALIEEGKRSRGEI